jgi:hypothetical protein
MTMLLRIVQVVLLFLTLTTLGACGADSRPAGGEESAGGRATPDAATVSNDPVVRRAAAVAEAYLVDSKRWDRSVFQLEYRRKDGELLMFVAHHSDDQIAGVGGGKSVAVYVDPKSGTVVKEMVFQ